MGMYRNKGVVGFITDGMVRDVVGIVAVGLPCYRRRRDAQLAGPQRPGDRRLPGHRRRGPDRIRRLIVADGDGVVVVPRAKVAATLKALEGVRAAEAALEAKVKAGLQMPEFAKAILKSDRVVEV